MPMKLKSRKEEGWRRICKGITTEVSSIRQPTTHIPCYNNSTNTGYLLLAYYISISCYAHIFISVSHSLFFTFAYSIVFWGRKNMKEIVVCGRASTVGFGFFGSQYCTTNYGICVSVGEFWEFNINHVLREIHRPPYRYEIILYLYRNCVCVVCKIQDQGIHSIDHQQHQHHMDMGTFGEYTYIHYATFLISGIIPTFRLKYYYYDRPQLNTPALAMNDAAAAVVVIAMWMALFSLFGLLVVRWLVSTILLYFDDISISNSATDSVPHRP